MTEPKISGNRVAAAAPTAAAKPLLGLNNNGPEVSALQTQLKQLGFDVKVDGKFGSETEKAVKAFQTEKGIKPADGIVGPKTREAMVTALNAEIRPIPGKISKEDAEKISQAAKDGAAAAGKGNEVLKYPGHANDPKTEAKSRLDEQQDAAKDLLDGLAQDAQVAAIIANPIFMPAALAISAKANARAIVRYETEVPQKDFSVLMAEEGAKARKEILGLPKAYQEYGRNALNAIAETSTDLALKAYEYGASALTSAAEHGGRLLDTAVEGTKKGFKIWWFLETAPIRALGSAMKWLGGLLSGGGKSMEGVGK